MEARCGGMRIRVGVGVVIRGPGETILLEKRRDCGWWGLPGGKVEPGESLIDASAREVLEETGLAVEVTHLIDVYSAPVAIVLNEWPWASPRLRVSRPSHSCAYSISIAWQHLSRSGPEVLHFELELKPVFPRYDVHQGC
jgi:8-oxo-dGTP pyrophosphatase MutT (NUDIX family)